jgi:hypothetical protein
MRVPGISDTDVGTSCHTHATNPGPARINHPHIAKSTCWTDEREAGHRVRITEDIAVTTDTDRLIVDELRAAAGDLIAVYRFGSTVHAATHRDSDTDLAVLMGQRLSPESRFDLQERIAAEGTVYGR